MIVFITDVKVREEDVRIVSGFVDETMYPPKLVTIGEILTGMNHVGSLNMFEDGEFEYTVSSGYILPTMSNINEDSDKVILFEDEFNIMNLSDKALFDEDFTSVDEQLSQLIPSYESEAFKNLCVSTSNTIDQILNFNFRYMVPPTVPKEIKMAVDQYNEDSKADTYVQAALSTGNVTLKMDNAESEVYIRVPTPTYIRNAALFDDFVGDSVDILEVHKALDPYEGQILAMHPAGYKDVIEEVGEYNIKGNPENNYLPIQNNERRFYAAIVRYINQSVTKYLEEERQFNTEELTRRLENNVLPNHTRIALKSFVSALINVNWRHSNAVPLNEFMIESMVSESGEDGETDSAELGSEYFVDDMFKIVKNKTDVTNYMVMVDNFMDDKNLTAHAWAEIIVKLARWGSRKPTAITITEEASGSGGRRILNLNDFTLQEDLTYLNELTPHDYNGKIYMPLRLISTGRAGYMDRSSYHTNLGYTPEDIVEDTPLGLMCRQSFDTESGIKNRNVYFDYPTIVELYKMGEGSIFGLDYDEDTNQFVVLESVEEQLIRGLTLGSILKLLERSHADRDIIFTNPGIYKEMNSVKKFRVKDEPIRYTMYDMVTNLLSNNKLTDTYSNASKEDDPIRFVTKNLSKAILNYIFLPNDSNRTLNESLNNFNQLYHGFEDIEVGNSFEGTIGRTSNFTGSNRVVEEKYEASMRINIKDKVYYVVKTDNHVDKDCSAMVVDSDEVSEVVELEGCKVHNAVSAYYTLAMILLQNQAKRYSSKVYMGEHMMDSIIKIYPRDHNMDIRKFVKVVQERLRQRKS